MAYKRKAIDERVKYTPEIVDKLCSYLKRGAYLEPACDAAGISKKTFCEWNKKHPEFNERVSKVIADFEIEAVDAILAIGHRTEQWQAIIRILEAKFPQRWSQRRKLDDEVAHRIKKDALEIERLTAEVQLLKKRIESGEIVRTDSVIPGTPEFEETMLKTWGFKRSGILDDGGLKSGDKQQRVSDGIRYPRNSQKI